MDGSNNDEKEDKRIVQLVKQVSEAAERNIPRLLIKLEDILSSEEQGSLAFARLKKAIWTYDLPSFLLLSLKQDFSKVPGSWRTAGSIAALLVKCCSGYQPKDAAAFSSQFLPETVDSLLSVARRIHGRYAATNKVLEETRRELLTCLENVLESLRFLLTGHGFLAKDVFKSQSLLQMLITDDTTLALVTMGVIQSTCRVKKDAIGEIKQSVLHSILDELIYKMSTTDDREIARSSISTVLAMCESHRQVIDMLCIRYKGLRPLLNRWHNRGFGRELPHLQLLLEAGSAKAADKKRLDHAASIIQAWWKGHRTRGQLRRANMAFSKFHRSFRAKRQTKEQREHEEKEKAALEEMLLSRRRQAMRNLRLKQMETLQILPAAEIPGHLAGEQTQAARRLQSFWRGELVRKKINKKQAEVKNIRAAVRIQREVRRWLERVKAKRQEPPLWQRPPGLTDARRIELQEEIQEWRELNKPKRRTEEELREFHNMTQERIKRQVLLSQKTRRDEQSRHALLAQLELDSSLLLSAPGLSEADENNIQLFTSHSVPIATKARHNHNTLLKRYNQPWWQKLESDDERTLAEQERVDWRIF